MRLKCFATLFVTFFSIVGCTAVKDDSKTQLLNDHKNNRTKVVLSVKDIWPGCLIDANQIEEKFIPSDKVSPNHINSVTEAIGKVSPKGMAMGTVICRDELALPTTPKPGEDWLLYFSESDLSKRVGKKIAIKGFLTDWIIGGDHKDNECAILSSDQLTYIRIGLPCEFSQSNVSANERHDASARRASWAKDPGINSVVIARGGLHGCINSSTKSNASLTYFLLDQRALTISKSFWCN